MRQVAAAALVFCAAAFCGPPAASACTAFCATSRDGHVLVGNNEDWFNPRAKIWFVPASPGAYGRMYVGFDDLRPFGGMNDRGLWYDGFAAPPQRASGSDHLPSYSGEIVEDVMAQCATVEEAIQLITRYRRSYLIEGILMFADASGDAVSIEANAIVRKHGPRHVQTNFQQSRGVIGNEPSIERFQTATAMLEAAGTDVSVDLFRRILAATHQENPGATTLYSNVYDLTSRTMYLYHFHDFDHVVTFRVDDELKKGERVLDIPSLFPRKAAADAFAAAEPPRTSPARQQITALAAVLVVGVVVIVGVVRAGRRARIAAGLAAACVGTCLLIVVGLFAMVESAHGPRSPLWVHLSFAPPTGESTRINPTTLNGDGPTLKGMIAQAYGFPAIRVSGPEWLSHTRYSVNATVGVDDEYKFRDLLREELERHLHLQSHVEVRPYDAFELRVTAAPRLPRAPGKTPSIIINKGRAQFGNASMEHITAALQTILGVPVVDKTGLTDLYQFELTWKNPPLPQVSAAFRDQFGLALAPSRVDMETLVIDAARRDPALFMLSQAGRVTRAAPAFLRDPLVRLLSID